MSQSIQEQLEEKRRAHERRKFLFAMLMSWGFSVAILFVTLNFWPDDPKDLFRPIVISTVANTVFFGGVYQYITKPDYDKIISGSLLLTLGGSPGLFRQIDAPIRKKFVEANLASTLGDETGGAVFTAVVQPMMEKTTPFRSNFVYHVTALDAAPVVSGLKHGKVSAFYAEIASLADYTWIEQEIGYLLRRPVDSALDVFAGPFEICLAFDDSSLDRLLRDEKVFFREVITLRDAHSAALLAFSEGEMEEFVRDVLGFRVLERISGKPAPYTVKLDSTVPGMPILRLVTQALTSADSIRITFAMPQIRTLTRFVFALPQPTEAPFIRFRRNAAMTALAPVKFMPNKVRETSTPERDPQEYQIHVEGWAFPTSGVVFTWQNRTA